MNFSSSLAIFWLAATAVIAQNASFVAQEIAQISPCGIECLELTIPAVGCSFDNTTCQCSSSQLVKTTSACMLANCTLAETLSLNKIQAVICQRPHESQNGFIRTMTIVTTIITNTAALLRFTTRLSLHQTLGLDDLFMAGAVITDALFVYFGVQLERAGFGNHVWDIDIKSISQLFYWFYICEMLYVMTIGLVKVSLLFFYLRVFPKKSFRIACWITIAFCASSAIAFTLVTIFQCHPIIYIWRKDLRGKCVNYNSVAWANAVINIFQDIIIILLPMNELRHLQLNGRKKIGMYAMFGVGSFVCITSMIRLHSLKTFGLTADPTWDNISTTFWSTLETCTAILCACMPAIRAGIIRFCRSILGLPVHSGSTSPNQPSKLLDDESIPARIVEGKPRANSGNSISLLPTSIGTKAQQFSKAATYEISRVGVEDSDTKHDIGSIRHIVSVTEYLRRTERDKPLPLLPISARSQSPKPSAEAVEMKEVEDSTENKSSTHHHSKGFV